MNKYNKPKLQSINKEVIENALGINNSLRIALEKLLIEGKIHSTAQGILEQLLSRGKKSLSEKQLLVYQKYVIKKHHLERYE
jgi:hypothetical protein